MSDHCTITTFSAWLRVGRRPWRLIASGPDEADVRRQLGQAARQYDHVDLFVTTGDRSPNERTRAK